ncbi:MAG TPA: SMP-30/gluconolactonase/LRE family protein [Steroidobacteraceae bacterium]|jgi:gluconolactonase|nr:SMP-30/gluconolactonase/LRE family protein [Steroidobacteraceae bacterium]
MLKFSGTTLVAGMLGVLAGLSAAVSAASAKAAPTSIEPSKIEDGRIDRWDPAMDAIVPKDWKIEKLAEGFGWAEGPIWVKSGGYLLFTDVPGNKMWKWSEKGGLEKFLDPSGAVAPDPAIWREAGANGLTIDGPDSILMADTGNRGIQRLDLKTKKKTPVAMAFEGKKFSSPNDVTKMKNGVLFFTDPPYGFKKFDDAPEKEIAFNGVYRAGADGKVTVIEKELTRPNGVALSPDERTLYVGQSEGTKAIINAYTLDKDGNVTAKKLFHDATDLVSDNAPGAPDGLTVAADGTVFTSAPGGVLVLSKDGKRLGRIWDGKQTANCKFGDDGKTLYLTSSNMLARIRLNIKGQGF